MSIKAAQDKPAAMKEHHQREWARAVRRIDADAQGPARPIDGLLSDARDLGGGRHQGDPGLVLRARDFDRQGVRGGHAGALVQ